MATEERLAHATLTALLVERGAEFDFFQAVRLLHLLQPNAVPVGHLGPAQREPVRFGHDPSLIFHPGDVSSIRRFDSAQGQPRFALNATFLGLIGATAPLATDFTERVLLAGEAQERLVAFYDIIHHRLLSLLYRIRNKYCFAISFRKGGKDDFTRRASALIGIDATVTTEGAKIPPQLLLSMAPLFAHRCRSARTLKLILQRLLPGIDVELEHFVPRRVHIATDERVKLGVRRTSLGMDMTLGRTVIDRSGRFRIHLGPVTPERRHTLQPGGAAYELVRGAAAYFSRGTLEAELEIQWAGAAQFRLGSRKHASLGVSTQLGGGTSSTRYIL